MSNEPAEKPAKRKTSPTLWFVLALVVALSVLTWLGRRPPVERVNWLSDYDRAAALATDTNRLLLIDFTARYCGACQYMDSTVFTRQSVADTIEAGYVPIKVDMGRQTSQSLNLVQRYRVWATPTLIITDRSGRQIDRVEGGITEDQMINWLRAVQRAKDRPTT
jgi:protein disulfide-isomerase